MVEAAPATTTTQQRRVLPQSELDFNLMTTNAVWGMPEVSQELKERLNKYFSVKDEKTKKQMYDKVGRPVVTSQSLWGLLGFYTRDMRLANLNPWLGELQYCQYYLDLANDFLQANLIEPFLISLSRVATILELSQSKGGFLRKKMNTFTQETIKKDEPPKKSLFGASKKKEGYT